MTREEAMKALSVLKIYDAQWLREAVDMAIKALEQEPKCGKWLPENADVPTYCSVCGHSWDEYIHGSEIWYTGDLPYFCPNCGAKMETEQ